MDERARKFPEGKAANTTNRAADGVQASYSAATDGAMEFQRKLLEIAQANINAAFDYANKLTSVRSMPEFIELSTAHTRKQFEKMAEQGRDLATSGQKMVGAATEPFASGLTDRVSQMS